jgi:hypothetical protein
MPKHDNARRADAQEAQKTPQRGGWEALRLAGWLGCLSESVLHGCGAVLAVKQQAEPPVVSGDLVRSFASVNRIIEIREPTTPDRFSQSLAAVCVCLQRAHERVNVCGELFKILHF